jgi:hypothetical protein
MQVLERIEDAAWLLGLPKHPEQMLCCRRMSERYMYGFR